MIDILDEITAVPFEVFWDKFTELHPGTYDRYTAEVYWVKMMEDNRLLAFESLCRFGSEYNQPWKHLQHFDLPF